MGICHLFSFVNFFIATFLQALYLVTQKVFFQNHYMDSPTRGIMPLVNIVPHMVLHQKMHVLVSEGFFGRWTSVPAPSGTSVSPWLIAFQIIHKRNDQVPIQNTLLKYYLNKKLSERLQNCHQSSGQRLQCQWQFDWSWTWDQSAHQGGATGTHDAAIDIPIDKRGCGLPSEVPEEMSACCPVIHSCRHWINTLQNWGILLFLSFFKF